MANSIDVRLLEDYEVSARERVAALKDQINAAWDDPRPSHSAAEVFDQIEARHGELASRRASRDA